MAAPDRTYDAEPSDMAAGAGVYLRLLRVPRLAPLLAAMAVGRLSVGLNPIAVVLFLRAERGSFGIAGLASGALALGTSLGAPLGGRLVDRFGYRLLGPLACAHAAGLVAIVACGEARAFPAIGLVLIALVTGAVVPPTAAVMRAGYRGLLAGRQGLLGTAFALDAVVQDVLFVLGPLLVSVLTVIASPGLALLVAAGTVVAGTLAFTVLLPPATVRLRGPRAPTAWRRLLGPMSSGAARALVAVILPTGIAFGVLDVTLPALARGYGHPQLAGLLIAVWSAASVAGGMVYGLARGDRSPARLHLGLALMLPVLMAPLLLSRSIALLVPFVVLAGLPIGPLLAVRNELAGHVAAPGADTELYTWMSSAMLAGVSIGAALGGILTAGAGARSAVLAAVGCALAGAAIALATRGDRGGDPPGDPPAV